LGVKHQSENINQNGTRMDMIGQNFDELRTTNLNTDRKGFRAEVTYIRERKHDVTANGKRMSSAVGTVE